MKPLPEAVQRAFPRGDSRVPARPWWHVAWAGRGELKCYRRIDDPHTTASTVEEVAAYDGAHPLPHPGYRAGQVWAREDGLSIVLTTVAHDWVWTSSHANGEPPSDFSREYPFLMADPACPHLAPWSPSEEKKS